MKNRNLYRNGNQFVRVIRENGETVLTTDCVRKTMPKWTAREELKEFVPCEEEELLTALDISLPVNDGVIFMEI